jgi:hypothetical protein
MSDIYLRILTRISYHTLSVHNSIHWNPFKLFWVDEFQLSSE